MITIRLIEHENILTILPLLSKVNTKTPKDLLIERVLEMSNLPNYECAGLFIDDKLVGISGLWYSTRHYVGKTVEPDHVIIDGTYRGQGLGKQFFNWIDQHVKNKGCESIELNTYVSNSKSHKFYYNEGYDIYGFHFLKILRDDKNYY
ncbi:MAG: GNAT family N-acetyltransferase [Polaribacter sp.]|uniref:GNAT family N-acetyltransferase n=1 Tax=Polaribacter sp. TaxID=1920175 RepID=UPI002F35FC02